MFRAAVRSSPRALRHSSLVVASSPTAGRRLASTAAAPADKKYTWKSTAARWGLAAGLLYWFNTSPIFADEAPPHLSPEPPQFSESDLPTVDAIVEEKRKQIEARLRAKEEEAQQAAPQQATTTTEAEKTPEQLEQEAGENQGAFNPETGEINWDCPCLGGMAHGPCGDEFKAAFSCFVYSNEEPKGMDCVDRFQHMQDCFRKHPDVYGEEIAEEEAAEKEAAALAASNAPAPAPASEEGSKDATTAAAAPPVPAQPKDQKKKPASKPKPNQQQQEATAAAASTHEFSTEEHKAGPTDAPAGGPPRRGGGGGDGGADEEDAHAKAVSEGEDERGIPKRSFDATSANASK